MIKDIKYLNSAIKQEISVAYQRLREIVADTDSITSENQQLLNEAAAMIGEISAKVNFLDRAIGLIEPDYMADPERMVLNVKFEKNKACIHAGDLTGIPNFLPMQITTRGKSYRWTSDNPVTDLTLLLSRDTPLELELHLVALIKPRYSKQMKIFADGKRLRHQFKKESSGFVSRCIIPASENAGFTKLTIVLPKTFAPKDLGVGGSTDKKGIAISRICFVKQW